MQARRGGRAMEQGGLEPPLTMRLLRYLFRPALEQKIHLEELILF